MPRMVGAEPVSQEPSGTVTTASDTYDADGEEKKTSILSAYVGNHMVNEGDVELTQDASQDAEQVSKEYEGAKSKFTNTFQDTAWRGDVVNSKIVAVSRDQEVKNAKITASDFVDAKGNVLSADNVEIHWLKYVITRMARTSHSTAPRHSFADALLNVDSYDIPAKTMQPAWININVPRGTTPGTYTGTLKLTADGLQEPIEFTYTIDVLNLVQPTAQESGIDLQLWQHPFAVAQYYGLWNEKTGEGADKLFTEEHLKLMRGQQKEYAAAGGSDLVASITELPWGHQTYVGNHTMIKWIKKKDGTFTYDYSDYDKWVEFGIECGVIDPETAHGRIKAFGLLNWKGVIEYYDEATGKTEKILAFQRNDKPEGTLPTSNEDRKKFKLVEASRPYLEDFLKDFMKHSEEKGWFDITYIAVDECPATKSLYNVVESVKNDQGEPFKMSAAMNYASNAESTFYIADASPNQSQIRQPGGAGMRKMSQARRADGLHTTFYNCVGDWPNVNTSSDPGEAYWSMMNIVKLDTDGYLRWAWDGWVDDPLNEPTTYNYDPGDSYIIYPMEADTTGDAPYFYSSQRWEIMKEGLRDVAKIKYLSKYDGGDLKSIVEGMKWPAQTNAWSSANWGLAKPATEADAKTAVSEPARMRAAVVSASHKAVENGVPATSLNTVQLESRIAELENVDTSGYTSSSAASFTALLDKARAVLGNVESQEALDAMLAELADAKDLLVLRAAQKDVSYAQGKLEAASDLEQGGYTPESWSVFVAARDALTAALADTSDVSAEQLNGLIRAFQDARADLVAVDGGQEPGETETPGDTEKPDDSGNEKPGKPSANGDRANLPATGDLFAPVSAAFALAGVATAGGGVLVARRRRRAAK